MEVTMGTTTDARAKGLRMAAKIAGVTLAIAGVVGAGGAAAAAPKLASEPGFERGSELGEAARAKLPFEDQAKAGGGNCGCTACWGPPAPPRKRRSARRSS
jgi:hypothetical protein